MSDHGSVLDLRAEVSVPQGGILSRTIHEDERVTLVVFGFDTGQELSEHTSARAAIIEILDGDATVTLGGTTYEAGPGAWFSMPPGMAHAIRATSPMRMALTLLR